MLGGFFDEFGSVTTGPELMGLDPDREVRWEAEYGDPTNATVSAEVIHTADGGYLLAGAKVVDGEFDVRVVKLSGRDGSAGGGDGADAVDGESDAPEFDCSFVELNDRSDEQARVAFADGSYVETADGAPSALGSPGRVVDRVALDGTTYENPDSECDPGEQATTFTCRCVTVGREEFVRSFGDAPSGDLTEVELVFADGTTERPDPGTDPAGTFRGTGENEGKLLAGLRLSHAAFDATHYWRNPHVDAVPAAD